MFVSFFFFNDTATTAIYTLSLHDALPISAGRRRRGAACLTCATGVPSTPRSTQCPTVDASPRCVPGAYGRSAPRARPRSEEHTSELQSRVDLVCRLLLEKKKKKSKKHKDQ